MRNTARSERPQEKETTEIQNSKRTQLIRARHTVCEISIKIDSTAVVTTMHKNRTACVVQHSEEHISVARIFGVCLDTITNLSARDRSRARALGVSRAAAKS